MSKIGKRILTSVVLASISLILTIPGVLNYNLIFHFHIVKLFIGTGDGNLGWFFLCCLINDILVIYGILTLVNYLRTKRKINRVK